MTDKYAKPYEKAEDPSYLDAEHLATLGLEPGVYAVSTHDLYNGNIEAYRLYSVTGEEPSFRYPGFHVLDNEGDHLFCLWGSSCAHQCHGDGGQWVRVEVGDDGAVVIGVVIGHA